MPKTVAIPDPAIAPQQGGRGPIQPPGLGGPDDWENQPQGSRGPRERLRRYRLGVASALVSIFSIFIAFASAYVFRHGAFHLDEVGNIIYEWRPVQMPALLWTNTLVLLLSSVTMEFARRQAFFEPAVMREWLGLGRETLRRSLPWLAMTIILGLGFLAGQVEAWRELYARGVFFKSNPGSSFFFLFTGLHALHLLGGLVAIQWALIQGIFAKNVARRQTALDAAAWYWHGMGLLWVCIFALLVLVP
jgi:cytochrome c oxidase subunit 3